VERDVTKKITLTPASIDALKIGKLADLQTPGLLIEGLSSGKKIWKYRRRIVEGGVINERLGLYTVHTIADARALSPPCCSSVS
jgi:hypothetical protein